PRAGRDPARRPAYRLPGARPVPAGDGNRTGPRGATRAPALRDLDAGLPRETGGIPALRRGDTARRVRGMRSGGPHVRSAARSLITDAVASYPCQRVTLDQLPPNSTRAASMAAGIVSYSTTMSSGGTAIRSVHSQPPSSLMARGDAPSETSASAFGIFHATPIAMMSPPRGSITLFATASKKPRAFVSSADQRPTSVMSPPASRAAT